MTAVRQKLSMALIALYILTVLWLVLFKLSFDLLGVLAYHSRSLNLIPFIDFLQGNKRETVDNLIIFIPFGLLLSVNFKQINWRRKLAYILGFSLGVEILQFILAIGITDITDIIMNTLGGFIGLASYRFARRHIYEERLDWIIVIGGTIILLWLLTYRIFVIKVKY